MKTMLSTAALLVALALPATAQEDAAGTADAEADASTSQGGTGALVNGQGEALGNVSVSATASGTYLVLVNAEGFPEGVLAAHLHMVGTCEGPDFESAGEHIADGHEHGPQAASGPHPGDLPNATVQADGVLAFDAFTIGLTEELLFDEDGSALIIHSQADDYTTQPSGDAGGRIACAVIEAGGEAGAAREEAEGTEAVEAEDDASGG